MVVPLLAAAACAQVALSPDRPAVGDSTGTPGEGHVVIEGGVAAVLGDGPATVGTSGIVARFGATSELEGRLRFPDLRVRDGKLSTGPVGVGFKVAGLLGHGLGASLVPELLVDTEDLAAAGSVGANLTWGHQGVGVWAHVGLGIASDALDTLLGGGGSVAVSSGGLYLNGGYTLNGDGFVGPGAWWAFTDAGQIDVGCDLVVGASLAVVPTLGTSIGW